MSWSKEDISFKKLSSKRVTWTSNQVFEEIGARSLDIHNLDIKADPIPDVPPGTTTSVLQFYNYSGGTGLTLVKDLTVSDNLTYFATIFNGSGEESLANQLVGTGATGRLFNFVSDIEEEFPDVAWIYKWFSTIFLYTFPNELVIIFWDYIFSESLVNSIKIAISIMRFFEKDIL